MKGKGNNIKCANTDTGGVLLEMAKRLYGTSEVSKNLLTSQQ